VAQTIAVTGVATGIGAELCRLLKADGHRVIGFDIASQADNVDRLIALDLSSPDSIQTAIDALDEPLNGLCNNAGIPPKEDGDANVILQVNFLGQRQLTRGMMKH